MKSEHTTYLHRQTDPSPMISFSHAAGRRVDLSSGKYLKLWQGPQHPGITGNMSLEVTLHGDEVVDLRTHVGYLHRGFEKLMFLINPCFWVISKFLSVYLSRIYRGVLFRNTRLLS